MKDLFLNFQKKIDVLKPKTRLGEATALPHVQVLMHDPFSMRPFFGYNFGQYLQHWLDTGARLANPPLVFMVNWFRSRVVTRDTCHIV